MFPKLIWSIENGVIATGAGKLPTGPYVQGGVSRVTADSSKKACRSFANATLSYRLSHKNLSARVTLIECVCSMNMSTFLLVKL
jgi:hypothetical protein